MSLRTWYYRGGRPNRVARLLDRGTGTLYALGIAPDRLVTLVLPGRRSGRTVRLPLVMTTVEGERYLVSMLGGNANWVRNVRAARGEVALRHGRRERARLAEVEPEHRAPVLREYLRRAPGARAHVPVEAGAPLAGFERVSAEFPVFRVVPRD